MRSQSDRSRSGRLSFSRCTVGATVGRRDPLDPRPPIQSYRTFGRVQGNYRDIVDAHYAATSSDFIQQQKLLSPVVTDGAVLHTIRATKDSYLGIKWLAENSLQASRTPASSRWWATLSTPTDRKSGSWQWPQLKFPSVQSFRSL